MPFPLLAFGRAAVSMLSRAAASTSRVARGALRTTPPRTGRGSRPAGGGGSRAGGSKGKKPVSPPDPDRDNERKLNRLWRYDTGWALFDRTTQKLSSTMPTFIHAIQVSVVGGPAADLRRVWYLACAAAFGRYRNRVRGVAEANMEAVWDVSGKGAKVSISYTLSGIAGNVDWNKLKIAAVVFGGASGLLVAGSGTERAAAVAEGKAAVGGAPGGGAGPAGPPVGGIDSGTAGGIDLLQRGPDQVTVGDGWPLWLRRQPPFGIPDAARVGTGNYPEFGSIKERCDDDALIQVFRPIRKVIDVLGELPVGTAKGTELPYGRLVPIESNFDQTDAVALRGLLLVDGKTYLTAPKMPDDGRVITTGEKRDPRVQPPRPWADGKSRMSLVEMVMAAIESPCTAPESVGCAIMPLGSVGGHRVFSAGTYLTERDVNAAPHPTRGDEVVTKVEIPRFGE